VKNDPNAYIGNARGGAMIRVVVTRRDNIMRKNITVNKPRLERTSSEYDEGLTKFIEEFKKKYKILPEQVKPTQNALYEFTNQVEGINLEEKVRIVVKQKILIQSFLSSQKMR
jgi:hypothetical protein